jgi:hypothetical protein
METQSRCQVVIFSDLLPEKHIANCCGIVTYAHRLFSAERLFAEMRFLPFVAKKQRRFAKTLHAEG